ncbi:hypothetical protein MJO29_015102 [Puccinia striiformis f. sp. tritici]|uniref:hypothetical protein n=1 Tax=Puccinia striiformis f. sp. tritici TaxID=168172 RepID=UPI0020081C20|nr:hypothetical protein Pst134EA_028157 [Puccinia striiformis f. sp. tritici]KAH9448865.1 hypothetical protein Pst134EA_028157 [Puccinia striiformis f. sp. tritici]KAI7937787.1 hypothetical protein MJO29_015102 [Puccinia striiformis f. sp. tritici]KAI9627796.1 hypothetical protein KEM48_011995 [Puccinia striiformis f. sp. tritici PST-130]
MSTRLFILSYVRPSRGLGIIREVSIITMSTSRPGEAVVYRIMQPGPILGTNPALLPAHVDYDPVAALAFVRRIRGFIHSMQQLDNSSNPNSAENRNWALEFPAVLEGNGQSYLGRLRLMKQTISLRNFPPA